MSNRSSRAVDDAILTYDLGTTRIKVALFALRGRLIGQRAARHREYREGNRAWQDADGWWSDAVRLTKELLAAKPRRVVAISVSGRGGAAVFIGRDGTVIGQPWSDRRHAAELRSLVEWRKGGAHLSNYAAALLAKKLWFTTNEPVRARQLRHALYAKDFLIYRLTGTAVTDRTSGPDAAQLGCPRARPHRQREPRAESGVAVGHRRTARSARGASARSARRHTRCGRRARWYLRERRRRRGPSGCIRDHARHPRRRSRHTKRRSGRVVPVLRPAARSPRDRRQCGDGRSRGGLVPRSRLRRERPLTGAALRRDGRSGRRRSGRLRRRALPAVPFGPGRTGIAPRRERGVHRPAHVARPLERVSRRAGRRRVRDPLDLRSDPGVVRRTIDAPAHRQRRAQPRSGARFWPARSGAPSRLQTRL